MEAWEFYNADNEVVKTVASREAREALPPLQRSPHSLFGGETSIEEVNMFNPTSRVVDALGNEYVVSGGSGTIEADGPMYSLSTFDSRRGEKLICFNL